MPIFAPVRSHPIAAVAGALSVAGLAPAQSVLFTTMDASNSVCANYLYPISTSVESRVGFPFVPQTDGQLTQVTIALYRGAGTDQATLELYADDGGLPGAMLGSWAAAVPVGPSGVPVATAVSISGGPTLHAGATYYLVVPVAPSEHLSWYLPATCQNTPVANQVWVAPGGGPWLIDPEPYAAFAILGQPPCYANCDGSTAMPVLNVNDFICFQALFAAGDTYANCDNSSTPPILNVNDFTCFQARFAAGCP